MSARDDILKKIDATVKRKKELSQQLSRDKTLAFWVSSFFEELEKIGNLDLDGNFVFTMTCNLRVKIQSIDKGVWVHYTPGDENSEPRVVITWSNAYVAKNNCDPQMVFDISTALMQKILE